LRRLSRQEGVVTLDEVVEVFRASLHVPDPSPLIVMLAAVAANRLAGPPVQLVIVGASSSGKTTLLDGLDGLEEVYKPDRYTVASLLTTGRGGQPGGVLADIERAGGYGLLVWKDLSTLLGEHAHQRAELLSLLRRVADGETERALGTDGGVRVGFTGKVGLLGASTGAIDVTLADDAVLGPRILTYRMPPIDDEDHVEELRAVRSSLGTGARGGRGGAQGEAKAARTAAVAELLGPLASWRDRPVLVDPAAPDPEFEALVRWSTWARSPVPRDGYSTRIVGVPEIEHGTRVYASVCQWLAGALALDVDESEARRLCRRIALDSIPPPRRRVLDFLLRHAGTRPTTRVVADETGLPTELAGVALGDLALLGLTWRSAEHEGGSSAHGEHHWSLAEEAWALARVCGLTLGMAVDPHAGAEKPTRRGVADFEDFDGYDEPELERVDAEHGIGRWRQEPR
jgi:hypothetical protein